MKDSYGRKIEYMRISITDRCNLRCRYCMPEGTEWLPMEEILTYEEIAMICREAVELGITRFKITGGEPLVRKGCPGLIRLIKDIPGVEQVTMTTNGVLLGDCIDELKLAGLDAVNVSLDTLDEERYREITGFSQLPRVLHSIECVLKSGIPVKINVVLQKGVNEDEWWRLAELARNAPVDVRFIELMPIGHGKERQGVSNEVLLERMKQRYLEEKRGYYLDMPFCSDRQICPDSQVHGNGPAVYYKFSGFQGSIGFISAIHGKFCESCNRIRLTSTGKLKPCLCFEDSVSVREAAREGRRLEVRRKLQESIAGKPQMHSFERIEKVTEKKRMSQIGG